MFRSFFTYERKIEKQIFFQHLYIDSENSMSLSETKKKQINKETSSLFIHQNFFSLIS